MDERGLTDPFKGKECRLEVNSFLAPGTYQMNTDEGYLKLLVPPELESMACEFARRHGVEIVGDIVRIGPELKS